jgi:putative transposase
MGEHILKRHNKNLLMYHLVCPAKYRKKIFTENIENTLKEICIGIGNRYEIKFIEIGIDEDHVHFMVQSVPTMAVSKIVTIIKSITAREIYKQHREVKKELTMGWKYMDEWVLCKYGWSIWKRRSD